MEEIKKQKQDIRDTVPVQCAKLDLDTLAEQALDLIRRDKIFLNTETVLAYRPFGHEIPFIDSLMKTFSKKEYYFPQVNNKEIIFYSSQGEPLRVGCSRAIIFLPAIAVDKSGNRLGRGWGCYDKFLSQASEATPQTFESICVVPECAVVDNLPIESHDMAVDKIIIVK